MADEDNGQTSQKQSNISTERQEWNAEAEPENDQIDQRFVSEDYTSESGDYDNQNFMSDDSIQNEAGKMPNYLYFLTTKQGLHTILASLVAIIAILVCRDIYMIQEIRRLENVLIDLPRTPDVQQWKRRQDQQTAILTFFINDVNDRLKTISKKNSEPREYECYHWTSYDLDNIHWNYTIATEKAQCERYPANVFTQGINKKFPGCNNCWCCTKVDGIFRPRLEPLKAESDRVISSNKRKNPN